MQKKALLLVGSARRPRSTSESLGSHVLERLKTQGFDTEVILIHRAHRSEEQHAAMLDAANHADVVVLAFPLYVDCLPALVTKTLEQLATSRRAGTPKAGQRLLAIVNCGFPETSQNETALAICHQFAREARFEWAGGLAMGAGAAIDGLPLEERGGMVRHVIAALDAAAAALAAGTPVPQETVALMGRPLMPSWTYSLFGGIGWRMQARRHGTQKRLYDRPFAE
ncbi:MAG: NAD(P)H-dependent oxidoreductase [Anaerolineae bacterium]|nr:NAD(P)H-dependent oxidoreductase [Anaerolineae bacterium]